MLLQLNGTEFYFDVEGAELEVSGGTLIAKPIVVALHGGPGSDHGYLKPGLGPLRDHAIVFVDLRGQGRSGRPPLASCTLEQMADDVAVLCAHLGIEHPVFFGHSAGGFVALHLAIRHPALPLGLIICDSAPTADAQNIDAGPTPNLASRASPAAVVAAKRLFSGDASPASLKSFGELVAPFYAGPSHMDVPSKIMRLSNANPDVLQHFWGNLAADYDVRGELSRIAAPTLVVYGRHDWIHPPAASRAIADGVPGAELVELAESAHLGFSEEPERFQEIVVDFLKRCREPETSTQRMHRAASRG